MTPKNISLISTELKTIHEQISFFEDSLATYSLKSGDIKDEANLTILQRIKSEFYPAILLFEQIKENGENLYPSIGLLLRACLMDIITFYYLTSFQKDKNTYRTELDVSDIDFFNNMDKLKKIEEIKPDEDGLKATLQKDYVHLLKDINECCFYTISEFREKNNVRKSLYCPDVLKLNSIADGMKFKQVLHSGVIERKELSLIEARYKLFLNFNIFPIRSLNYFIHRMIKC